MLAELFSAASVGIESVPLTVEVDIASSGRKLAKKNPPKRGTFPRW